MTFEDWWEKEGEDLFLDEPDVEVVMQKTWLAGQASAQTKWRPIETAPKDGTYVLICDANDPSLNPIIAGYRFGKWRSRPTTSGYSMVWSKATHWMPLPQPPAGKP